MSDYPFAVPMMTHAPGTHVVVRAIGRRLFDAHVWDLPGGTERLIMTVGWEDETGREEFVFDATVHHSDGIQRGPRMCRVHDDCRALPALGNACAEVTNE